MIRLASIILTVLTVVLGGCAFPLAPNKSEAEVVATITEVEAAPSLERSRKLVEGWRNIYHDEARHRQVGETILNEAMFYGSIFSAVSVARGSLGKAKTGAVALAALGLVEGHYMLTAQARDFEKAENRLKCFQLALGPLDPRLEELAATQLTGSDVQELLPVMLRLPSTIRANVEKVRDDLQTALKTVALKAYSAAEIKAAYDKIVAAQTPSPSTARLTASGLTAPAGRIAFRATSATPDSASAIEVSRFIEALRQAEAKMTTCFVENPQ
jgi:hypothetical protein